MQIATRPISAELPPYVIAELGVNHDGSVERALELVDAAAEARVDAVKLQFFRTDLLMSKAAKLAVYQSAAGETDPLLMLRRLELGIGQMQAIVERAHKRSLHAIVTVFSTELVAEAQTLAWDAYKTASPDLIHKPLLDALAKTGKPLIVSTGAANMEEIHRAISWLAPAHARLALLQCVSSYPTGLQNSALGGIKALQRAFPGPVGYSDHTSLLESGGLAVAAGARILEKHLTYDNHAKGPDHAASLTGVNMAVYVRLARQAWQMLGPETKRVLDIEQDVRQVSRQSLTTARAIPKGHPVTEKDITIKRPGTGLEPEKLRAILGRKAARDLDADMPLTDADLLP